jgi:DNA-binding MarR family transcriptional regulator
MCPGGDHIGSVGMPGGGPASPSDGRGLYELLRLSHIFASAVREVLETNPRQVVSECPLTAAQIHLLALTAHDGPHQVGEVAGLLGLSPAAATKNIDKLERLELVARSASSGDRRATILTISPRGRMLVREYQALKLARLSQAVAGVPAEERASFARLLVRFALALLHIDPPQAHTCLRCDASLATACPVGQHYDVCPYQGAEGVEESEPPAEGSS